MFLVGKRRAQHLLQRLDLVRQAAVLSVDEHGDQGGIWLGDGNDSLYASSVKREGQGSHENRGLSPIVPYTRKALMEKPRPSFEGQGFNGFHLKHLPEGGCLSPGEIRPASRRTGWSRQLPLRSRRR